VAVPVGPRSSDPASNGPLPTGMTAQHEKDSPGVVTAGRMKRSGRWPVSVSRFSASFPPLPRSRPGALVAAHALDRPGFIAG
jgi:hypothetical protein